MSCGDSSISGSSTTTVTASDNKSAVRVPFFARAWSPAPRFCPTKVVTASEIVVMGRSAKESILLYDVQPAMQSAPKRLI